MDPILGQIVLFAYGDKSLWGWLPCEGQILQVTGHESLFALLGNKYGGSWHGVDTYRNKELNTFALPNLKGKEPIPNTRYYIAIKGTFPSFE